MNLRRLDFRSLSLIASGICVAASTIQPLAAEPATTASEFNERIRPFLSKHCFQCHGKDSQEGDFRLDTLPLSFASRAEDSPWLSVFEKLKKGEMPPKDEPRPDPQEIQRVVRWIDRNLTSANAAQQREDGRVVLRRLNRVEYENTIHDLLDIEVDIKDLLPEDNVAHGFDNIGEALNVSSVLMERYLEAADVALDAAIVKGERPKSTTRRLS